MFAADSATNASCFVVSHLCGVQFFPYYVQICDWSCSAALLLTAVNFYVQLKCRFLPHQSNVHKWTVYGRKDYYSQCICNFCLGPMSSPSAICMILLSHVYGKAHCFKSEYCIVKQ